MSEPSPDEVEEARRWLGEAEEELVVVEVLLADKRSPVRAACFHAHLAAEKALKALVIFRAVPLPKSHDLARLLQLLPPADASQLVRSDLVRLSPWTIEGRYPADLTEPSDDEVRSLAAASKQVVETARSLVVP
jgi:HEPN domain-containing protein